MAIARSKGQLQSAHQAGGHAVWEYETAIDLFIVDKTYSTVDENGRNAYNSRRCVGLNDLHPDKKQKNALGRLCWYV